MRSIIIIFFVLLTIGCSNSVDPESLDNTIEDSQVEKIDEVSTYRESEEYNEIEEEILEEEVWEVQYKVNESIFKVEPIVEGVNEKVVLLTIDDAPDQYGVEMAEILKRLEVGAIFFVNGHFLKDKKGIDQLKRIHELGFEIGNHTMNHPNLSKLSESEQRKEIIELNNLIEEIIGERPRFFRAPFGVNTEVSNKIVDEEGMQWMNWSYGYDYDPNYMDAESLADIMVNTPLLINGSNLLLHDREFTKDALEDIVVGLRNKGYEFVHPKQLQ